ncbi:protein-L-isoaspartate(D-aspartate) O-methyltransferase [Stratiformator vulcanicus]|uniref:Protein-L-isoaspartate O-methyltransferase n=1 Tax=Stratiformator vulcanicus TaxID=2527980 RepID=A0A517QZR5_9PLAN|nr:protein-L-isoaspartate(D-aspartate) O-methyltransferase [Stratiformator vulcanicus]QDT37108.1 Protein-L-isoaspartate O-methyltransferase [Stratiformator vulcanicus]
MSDQQSMIDSLRRRGIHDERVLEALATTPRERFVATQIEPHAYADSALPIACGQTISQPYIVALMTQSARLTGREAVLEIGTGSGYQAAILAKLASRVVSIERYDELAEKAAQRLAELKIKNVEIHVGDGTSGDQLNAPYDAIVVTAGAPEIPEPLIDQLAERGRLIIPVGDETDQVLKVLERSPEGDIVHDLCPCRFVNLIGKHGWSA